MTTSIYAKTQLTHFYLPLHWFVSLLFELHTCGWPRKYFGLFLFFFLCSFVFSLISLCERKENQITIILKWLNQKIDRQSDYVNDIEMRNSIFFCSVLQCFISQNLICGGYTANSFKAIYDINWSLHKWHLIDAFFFHFHCISLSKQKFVCVAKNKQLDQDLANISNDKFI